MNIKEQVLSIAQIQELQELGFDIEKYASMCWLPPANEVNSFSHVNKQFWDAAELKYIPTLTIGDILDVLPTEIDEYVLNINKREVSYYDIKTTNLFYAYRHRFIDSLFYFLVWCIKNKHIAL